MLSNNNAKFSEGKREITQIQANTVRRSYSMERSVFQTDNKRTVGSLDRKTHSHFKLGNNYRENNEINMGNIVFKSCKQNTRRDRAIEVRSRLGRHY